MQPFVAGSVLLLVVICVTSVQVHGQGFGGPVPPFVPVSFVLATEANNSTNGPSGLNQLYMHPVASAAAVGE